MLWNYEDPDPLAGLPKDLPPLPEGTSADGKSLASLPPSDSQWYHSYPEVLDESNNAFDFHIYYNKGAQMEHARKLHERIRREFPELRVYKFWEIPVGPHPVPMFEVNTFTPAQFGALFGFLVAFRGSLSVLIHPNTDDPYRDHTDRATWMGERYPCLPAEFGREIAVVAMDLLVRPHLAAVAAKAGAGAPSATRTSA